MRKLENKIKYILVVAFFAAFAFSNSNLAYAAEFDSTDVINFLNQEREENNLDILIEDQTLSQVAQMKAEDMIKNDYFAHTSPQGKSPWYWFEKGGYDYKFAGENLAVNYSNAEEQHEAWMNSPTHRANILNPNYREVGVAVMEGKIEGEKSTITVQLFGTLMVAAVKPQETESVTPEQAIVTEAESAELASVEEVDVPIGIVPAAKASSSIPIESLKLTEVLSISGDKFLGIAWLVVVSLLYGAIISSALAEVGKSCRMMHETFRRKEVPQRILMEYGRFLKRIKINMQHAGLVHPARGRPG